MTSQTPPTEPAPPPAPAPAPTPLATPATPRPEPASDGLREAVTARSDTAAGVVETLDGLALTLGETRISVWDALVALLLIAAVLFAAAIVIRLAKAALRRVPRLDPVGTALAEKLIAVVIWALAFFLAVDALGIDLTALAVFSGAFGLAIGFGLQKTFGNLIAGIILLMDKSIKPGDVIAVNDSTGRESFGQIRRIGIRAVSVTTRDQREYLIPNENLMVNQVENWSYSSRNVRIQVPVGVSYDTDLELVEGLMLQAAKTVPRLLTSPAPAVWLHEFGDSSVNFIIQCWINDPEEGVGNVRSDVLKKVWRAFKENDVEIPFPQRDLNLRGSGALDKLADALGERVGKAASRQTR